MIIFIPDIEPFYILYKAQLPTSLSTLLSHDPVTIPRCQLLARRSRRKQNQLPHDIWETNSGWSASRKHLEERDAELVLEIGKEHSS